MVTRVIGDDGFCLDSSVGGLFGGPLTFATIFLLIFSELWSFELWATLHSQQYEFLLVIPYSGTHVPDRDFCTG